MRRRKKKEHYTTDSVRELFREKGCELLTDTITSTTQDLDYICKCGHRNTIQLYRFKRGQGIECPTCVGNKKKTIDEVSGFFEKNGCILLTKEYKWNRQKVDYIAQCGHRHTIKVSAFYEGEGRKCPACVMRENHEKRIRYTAEQQADILRKRGCVLIKPCRTTNDKMVYIAQCGHKHEMRIEYFLKGFGFVCDKCTLKRTSVGEIVVKDVLDSLGIKYERQFKIKTSDCNFQRLDFYLPDFGVAIEYNGRQHYEADAYYNRVGKGYEYQKNRDLQKLRYCQEHGIRMIYIDGRRWSQKRMINGDLRSFVEWLCVNEGFVRNKKEK